MTPTPRTEPDDTSHCWRCGAVEGEGAVYTPALAVGSYLVAEEWDGCRECIAHCRAERDANF